MPVIIVATVKPLVGGLDVVYLRPVPAGDPAKDAL